MRNHFARSHEQVIPYRPLLRLAYEAMAKRHGWDKTRISANAIILIQQLDFNFSLTDGEPFAKFVAPPTVFNPYYEQDSWTEELSFSKDEFSTAFASIGQSYASRTQWINAVAAYNKGGDCPFAGRLYASYYDRKAQVMVWVRNHALADELFEILVELLKERKPITKPPKAPGSAYPPVAQWGDPDTQSLETGNASFYMEAKPVPSIYRELKKENNNRQVDDFSDGMSTDKGVKHPVTVDPLLQRDPLPPWRTGRRPNDWNEQALADIQDWMKTWSDKPVNRFSAVSYCCNAEIQAKRGDTTKVDLLTALLADAQKGSSPAPEAAQEPLDTLDWPTVKKRINKALGTLTKAGHAFYGALPNESMAWGGFVDRDWKAWGREHGVPDHMYYWEEQHREPLLEFLAWLESKAESLTAKNKFA